MTNTRSSAPERKLVRYLEFYAGVGGWTMALQEAVSRIYAAGSVRLECCAALDHSDLCTSVYQHNHGQQQHLHAATTNGCGRATSGMKAVRIERLTAEQLKVWQADLWMMSPPCQPHTRQHSNQAADLDDARSDSFLHLCNLLVELEPTAKPSIILMENVVGFEKSQTCRTWMDALASSNFNASHFHLQPTQAGLPNDRPRYYCVAIRRDTVRADRPDWMQRYFEAALSSGEANGAALQPLVHLALEELGLVQEVNIKRDELPLLRTILDKECALPLRVPESVLQRPAAWCLDIVTAASRRTSCFTSAYGKYVKGTGSVLLQACEESMSRDAGLPSTFAMVSPEKRQYDPHWATPLTNSGYYLRYFSGSELARLFGFGDAFSFPSEVTVKQQWKLVGNSLNVRVASRIVELGLRSVSRASVCKR